MLGTTETKGMMSMSAKEIAEGVRTLIKIVKEYRTLPDTKSPEIIILIPPVIKDTAKFASVLFKGGTKISRAIITEYKKVCKEESIRCVDSNEVVQVDKKEGIHLTKKSHKKLGEFMYQNISN